MLSIDQCRSFLEHSPGLSPAVLSAMRLKKTDDTTLSLHGQVPLDVGSALNMALHKLQQQEGARQLHIIDRSGLSFAKHRVAREAHIQYSVSDSELVELSETPTSFKTKVQFLVETISEAKGSLVVHTGAGISTACKIPDFRGRNGVWTRRDRGQAAPACIPLEQAVPSFTHNAVRYLLDDRVASYLVSQNVDGLHRRSGVRADQLSELHGNCFREICAQCNAEFLRSYNVTRHQGPHFQWAQDKLSESGISHITGRKCQTCKEGMLRDSVIHFKESLPQQALERADRFSRQAAVSLCLGTSLNVSPANSLPESSRRMFIVNLSCTGKDEECLASGGVLIHAKCDDVMRAVMQGLYKKSFDQFQHSCEQEQRNLIDAARQKQEEEVEPPAATVTSRFFNYIGLPPVMQQRPSHLRLVQTYAFCEESDSHKWSLCVALPEGYPSILPLSDYIERVVYHLHPTFSPNQVEKKDAATGFCAGPYIGWGVFRVSVTIHWAHGYGEDSPLECSHMLSFGADNKLTTKVVVPKLQMNQGFLQRIASGTSLRPTQTRVRRIDGTTYIE